MDQQHKQWKFSLDRLWSVAAPDYREAARLAADIARGSGETALRQAAEQALSSLRNAVLKSADRSTKDHARRRLSAVRDILHALDLPQFGKRRDGPTSLTSAEHHRHLLGLPLGRFLSGVEIHDAYKRVAKTAHPDAGGSEREFRELCAAQDALMKER
jgi:hypothetical protein